MATFRLRVVTPERTVLDRAVQEILTRSVEGELGVLPRHMPLITPLVANALTVYVEDQSPFHVAVAGGFLEVNEREVLVLADSAELPEDIDVARAESARNRAQSRLEQGGEEVDVARAKRALARAESRLAAVDPGRARGAPSVSSK